MKKILSIFWALALLAGCAAAEVVPAKLEGTPLELDVPVECDLNNDGAPETIQARMRGMVDEQCLQLSVVADGAVSAYDTDLRRVYAMYLLDIDGDGIMEILVTGDVYSEDYATWVLHYDPATGLTPLPFDDANRGDNGDIPYDYGYGMLTAMDGQQLTLTGSQDVLGTWMASRTFTMKDGAFVLDDGGLWQMLDIRQDEFVWEYSCLVPVKEIPVVLEDGTQGSLQPGEKFIITQSDKLHLVHFITEGGIRGSFAIEPDVENGWGSLIQGVNEYEWFEYVPYAD